MHPFFTYNLFLANLIVYGLIGLTCGMFGIIGVKTNVLSCFQTYIVLSLSLSVFVAANLFCLWLFSFVFCQLHEERFFQFRNMMGLSFYTIVNILCGPIFYIVSASIGWQYAFCQKDTGCITI